MDKIPTEKQGGCARRKRAIAKECEAVCWLIAILGLAIIISRWIMFYDLVRIVLLMYGG